MDKLIFGPAGVPSSAEKKSSVEGVKRCGEIGFGAMELEFVHGVRMKPDLAEEVGKAREEAGIKLTAHGPYYINLNAKEEEKRTKSRQRILRTACIANIAGAYSITFHPAFYLGMDEEKVYSAVKKQMEKIVQDVRDEGIKLWIRPELTGKPTQFGDLKQLVKLSSELDQVLPCIDWSHMHARTNGKWNSYEEFCEMLDMVEGSLGKEALKNMHCHISGIEYGEKGEKNHLHLPDSDMKYKELLKAMKDYGCRGILIAEAPDPEVDAKLLQKTYSEI